MDLMNLKRIGSMGFQIPCSMYVVAQMAQLSSLSENVPSSSLNSFWNPRKYHLVFRFWDKRSTIQKIVLEIFTHQCMTTRYCVAAGSPTPVKMSGDLLLGPARLPFYVRQFAYLIFYSVLFSRLPACIPACVADGVIQ